MIKNDKRQVIKLGTNGGLAMTLPRDWCRTNDIKQGQMIQLEEVLDVSRENGTGLILRVIKWSEVGNTNMPGQSPANGLKTALEGKGKGR